MSNDTATLKVKLSQDAITAHQTTRTIKHLKDTVCPQLYFRYFKNRACGSFWVVMRIPGLKRPKWFRLGNYDASLSPYKARQQAQRMVSEKCYRATPELIEAARHGRFKTVTQLMTWYENHVKRTPISNQRATQIRQQINKHYHPFFAERSLKTLIPSVVDEFTKHLLVECKPGTARKILGLLFKACNEARRLGIVDVNPCQRMDTYQFIEKSVTEKNGRIGRLNMGLLPRLFQRLHAISSLQTRALVQLCFLTWGRIGEISQAKWRDYDNISGRLKVIAKGGIEHTIYTNTHIEEVLDTLKRYNRINGIKSDYIFFNQRNHKKPISADAASSRVRHFAKKLWSAHDVRKFCSSWASENGVDKLVGQYLLAHELSDLDRTYIQTHLVEQQTETLFMWANVMAELGLFDKQKAVSAALAQQRGTLRPRVMKIVQARKK